MVIYSVIAQRAVRQKTIKSAVAIHFLILTNCKPSRLDALAYCKHTRWTSFTASSWYQEIRCTSNDQPYLVDDFTACLKNIRQRDKNIFPKFWGDKTKKTWVKPPPISIYSQGEGTESTLTCRHLVFFFGTDISRYHTQHRMDDFCNLEVSELADDVLRHSRIPCVLLQT